MSNPGMRLTTSGKNILAKGLTGKEINFSKVAYGDGDFDYNSESVADLTQLRNWKMDLPIVGKQVSGDGIALIKAQLINVNLANGFRAKEIGVYATDPDTGDEVLYAYRNAGEEYSFVPGGAGPVKINVTKSYWVEIGDAENVTFNIDWSFAYVSQEDFNNHIDSEEAHPIITDRLNVVERTANNADTLAKAKFELAGDFNLLVVENFDDTSVVDMLKIKVLSCGRGGNLIQVDSVANVITGDEYTITDGINQEVFQVASVIKNAAGYYLQTVSPLTNTYDSDLCYVLKSTIFLCDSHAHCACEQKYFDWKGFESFAGYPANIPRTYKLNTSTENADAFIMDGDGFLTYDGFFTLKRDGE